jgi:hypothetical protein
MAVVLRQSLALALRRCFWMVLTDGLPVVRMVAEYPVNALLMIVVIFLLSWPLSGDGVRFAVGWMVGNY